MDTLILTTDKSSVEKAGQILKNGGLVAIPTETVYGLAANALDAQAVKKIFVAKGRPQDNPLIVHISALTQIDALIKERSEVLERLANAFWPGPLTIISEKSDIVPDEVTCGLDTVAVRFPSSEIAREIITAAGVPLAAPSANLSGSPSPTSFEHCFADLNGRVDAIVDGPECEVGVESTVITIVGGRVRVLRPGAVTVEMLEAVVGEVEIDKAVLNQLDAGAKVSSPGMKYKHYAPKAKVIILDGDFGAFSRFVGENLADGVAVVCFEEDEAPEGCKVYRWGKKDDHETQARLLFDILRQTDADGIKKVFVHSPERDGLGLAVYNRLLRAAGFEVIKLGSRVIGLTGQTGAGKSAVRKILEEARIACIDCDLVAREVTAVNSPALKALCEVFGEEILTPEKALDRKKLGSIVFSSKEKLEQLNKTIFPFIIDEIKCRISGHTGVVVLDAPTLFESGCDKLCDTTVAVVADQKLRLERIIARDGISAEDAENRINSQLSENFFRENCDAIIENNDDLYSLEKAVQKLIQEWKRV